MGQLTKDEGAAHRGVHREAAGFAAAATMLIGIDAMRAACLRVAVAQVANLLRPSQAPAVSKRLLEPPYSATSDCDALSDGIRQQNHRQLLGAALLLDPTGAFRDDEDLPRGMSVPSRPRAWSAISGMVTARTSTGCREVSWER